MLQHQRRHDPYPFTWELPVAALLAVVLVMVLGIQAGRTLAIAATGGGWWWADARGLFSSLPGILTGHADSGLRHPVNVPQPVLAGWIIATDLLLLTLTGIAGWWAWRHFGPTRLKGMASRADAEATLGLTRLRRVRHIIRPDLYPGGRHD